MTRPADVEAPGDGAEVGWDAIPVDGPETVAEKRLLASLGLRARVVNLSRVLRLRELIDVAGDGSLSEAGRREAESLAHQVVGSAGTFGHPRASQEAAAVEQFFAPGGEAGTDVRPEEVARLRGTIDRLRVEFGG